MSIVVLLMVALLAWTLPCLADERQDGPWADPWMEYRKPTTDWFGWREPLAAWGITPSLRYGADFLTNVTGGRRHGAAYAGEMSMDVDLDLEKLLGLPGLRFHTSADWTSGSNLSDAIGNFFPVAQFAEGRQGRLYTMFLQQSLLGGRLDVKLGRFGTGDDFLTSPTGVTVVNETLNPVVIALQANVPSVTAEPNATWGGRVLARPTDTVSLTAGIFYSDPRLDLLTANGTEFAIDTKAGYFLIGEASYYLNQGRGARGLPGRYRAGVYYDSNRYAHLDDPRRTEAGNYGFYLMGEQMVFSEGKVDDGQGLSLYATFTCAPRQSINTVPFFVSAGVGYQGLVPGRDEDTAVFALYYGRFSHALPRRTHELTLEWTYAIKVTRWLAVQPDVQYVIRPSGRPDLGNALVLGAQLQLSF